MNVINATEGLDPARRQAGFGLLETGIAMVVVLGILGGALAMFGSHKGEMTANRVEADYQEIHRSIERLYRARPGYDGLTEEILATSGALPDSMVVGDKIIPSSRREMNIYTGTVGACSRPNCVERYGIKFWDLTVGVCKKLAHRTYPGTPQLIAIGADHTNFYEPFSDRNGMADSCEDTRVDGTVGFRIFYTK